MSELWIPLLFAGAALLVTLALKTLYRLSKTEDRGHLDSPRLLLKFVWPALKIIDWLIVPWFPDSLKKRIHAQLQKAGLDFLLSPTEFLALCLLSSLLGLMMLFTSIHLSTSEDMQLGPLWTLGGLVGAMLPVLKTRDLIQQRQTKIVRDLPVFLDFLIMSVEAGLNLNGALQQAVRHGPEGPLRDEWARVLRDIRAGLARREALRQMSERLAQTEIKLLISALIQAENTGSSLAVTLKIQAEQRRTERFQKAEKLAMQAPVKLVFPLVAFIFPVTFLILAFPIGMKLASGF